MRLIDAGQIINALSIFSDRKYGNEHFLNGIDAAKEVVVNCPTVDAVEVVRCKDCVSYQPTEGGKPFCYFNETATGSTNYCSYGERREEK